MARVELGLHSPLTLLHEWKSGHLRELVVTGYTLDLVFFERYCVPQARALGARVTVLSDAGHPVHEAVDVRHAGRTYQHGHVACAGAFHPKLAVLVGDEEIWAAIGSGNPTASGWGHNDELWLVIKSPRAVGPAALETLAEWLRDLPTVVAMPSWISETVNTVAAAMIPDEIDNSLPGLRIVGNLRTPMIDQLPHAPVDNLRLSAPFLDPGSRAVAELVARMSPRRVAVAVQEKLSWYDGATLAEATAHVAEVEFRFLDECRTSHGKLIEWAIGSEVTALVGSANLTGAALLRSTDRGGNCELGAGHPVEHSLLPDGTSVVTSAEMRILSTTPARDTSGDRVPLILLGARRGRDEVQVELLARSPISATIEMSPTGAPGSWRTVHIEDIDHPGRHTACFVADEGITAAVRAAVTGSDGPLTSVVFLTDVARCLPREIDDAAPRVSRDYGIEDFITDPVLAERLSNDLLRLMKTAGRHRAGQAGRTPTAPTASDNRHDTDRWGRWLDGVQRSLGPAFSSLLFPGLAGVTNSAEIERAEQWSVDDGEPIIDITDDEAEEDIDPIDADDTTWTAPEIAPDQRAAWRTRSNRLCRAVSLVESRAPLELRMGITRIYIDLLAAGVWDSADSAWRHPLSDILVALPPKNGDDDVPEASLDYMSSLLVVGLALLGQGTTIEGGRPEDVLWWSVWTKLREWIARARIEIVADYLYAPTQSYARVTDIGEVTRLIKLATETIADPHAETRAKLAAAELHAKLQDGIWVAEFTGRSVRRTAARIATLVGDPCAVIVVGTASTCAILRSGPTVVMGERSPAMWHVMQLRSPIGTPASLLTDGLPSNRARMALRSPSSDVFAVAAVIGIDVAQVAEAIVRWRSTL
ncbi:hypothetical protein [Nocardia sp. NPDC057227]|uniref:hypothetical protein n=1 Tax=Nocardia sp. NPDC057227 TaxID=3346056 RepID=UPI0036459739